MGVYCISHNLLPFDVSLQAKSGNNLYIISNKRAKRALLQTHKYSLLWFQVRKLVNKKIFSESGITNKLSVKGEKVNYKVVAMEEFQTSDNGFLNFLGIEFWSRSFY